MAQVYQPRHVIIEAARFLSAARTGVAAFEGRLGKPAGQHHRAGTRDRAVRNWICVHPRSRSGGRARFRWEASAERVELYLRPAPDLAPGTGAVDIVMRQPATPAHRHLTAWVGDDRPARVEIGARNHQSAQPACRLAAPDGRELGANGGRDTHSRDDRYPQGRCRMCRSPGNWVWTRPCVRRDGSSRQQRGSRIWSGRLLGGGQQQGNAMMMLDALAPRDETTTGPEDLRRFPPLDLRDGRVFMGPIPIPQVRLQPVF